MIFLILCWTATALLLASASDFHQIRQLCRCAVDFAMFWRARIAISLLRDATEPARALILPAQIAILPARVANRCWAATAILSLLLLLIRLF